MQSTYCCILACVVSMEHLLVRLAYILFNLSTLCRGDWGDFGHYTQHRAEVLNHKSTTIYMYTNTKYDACKRLRMMFELA